MFDWSPTSVQLPANTTFTTNLCSNGTFTSNNVSALTPTNSSFIYVTCNGVVRNIKMKFYFILSILNFKI